MYAYDYHIVMKTVNGEALHVCSVAYIVLRIQLFFP